MENHLIFTVGKKNYGIMFEMHYHKHGPHKGHLHVDVSMVIERSVSGKNSATLEK